MGGIQEAAAVKSLVLLDYFFSPKTISRKIGKLVLIFCLCLPKRVGSYSYRFHRKLLILFLKLCNSEKFEVFNKGDICKNFVVQPHREPVVHLVK